MTTKTAIFALVIGIIATLATLQQHHLVAAMSGNGFDGQPPPMGHSTWCTDDGICGLLWEKCSATEIMTQARAMVSSGLHAKGYNLILLDDCWSAKTRSSTGNLQPDAVRFPNGISHLSRQLQSLNLSLGVYSCIGERTCKHGLPGSFGHYEADARWLVSQGVKYVKIDNCAKPGKFSEQELYANFSGHLVAAAAAANTKIWVAACEWGAKSNNLPAYEFIENITNSYRIQMDHLPLWDCPLPYCHAAGAGFGQGTSNIIRYASTLPKWRGGSSNKSGGVWSGPNSNVNAFGDPDFLMTMYDSLTMSFIASRTEFSFWSLWSAPLVVATTLTPPASIAQQKFDILGNVDVIAIDQDPAGIPGFVAQNNSNGGQIWLKPLASGDAAVIFYNSNNVLSSRGKQIKIEVDSWKGLLAAHVTSVQGMDLWAQPSTHRRYQDVTAGYTAMLVAADIKMLRLRCTPGPCMV